MSSYQREATNLLGYARTGCAKYLYFLERMRQVLKDGNLSLADIGTSEEEISRVIVANSKESATRWLNFLRGGHEMHARFVENLRNELFTGKLSLSDIGTDEVEIASLVVLGKKAEAVKWLDYIRRDKKQFDNYIQYFRDSLKENRLTLEDVGTSEKELATLRKAA